MSEQQPPPPPWGSGPSAPYGGPPAPGGGLSNKARFWIGVPLALPAVVVIGIVLGIASGIANASPVGFYAGVLVVVAAFVAGLVVRPTRFFALGVIAGLAVLFVVGAGVCAALIASYQ